MSEQQMAEVRSAISSLNSRLNQIKWIVGLGVTIICLGIPWAFTVHGKISAIETKLDAIPPKWLRDKVDYNTEDLTKLNNKVDYLENKIREIDIRLNENE